MADPITESLEPTGEAPEGTTEPEPSAEVGTTVVETEAPESGPAEDSFFDPSALSPELLPAYKQMQAAYTKKTMAIAEGRNKIAEYDRFLSDPAFRASLAAQYGLTGAQQSQAQPAEAEEWQPDSWADVIQRAKQETRDELIGELAPLLQEVRGVKKTQVESDLDSHIPEWRQYEDEMSATLQQHPTLANDPVKLARLALPEEVIQSKAMQQALKKLEGKAKGAQISGGSTTRAAPEAGARPNRKLTFDEAANWARNHLAGLSKRG